MKCLERSVYFQHVVTLNLYDHVATVLIVTSFECTRHIVDYFIYAMLTLFLTEH